jgi:hypothetical protein
VHVCHTWHGALHVGASLACDIGRARLLKMPVLLLTIISSVLAAGAGLEGDVACWIDHNIDRKR